MTALPSKSKRHHAIVIGLGNGGCKTVNYLAGQWAKGPELVALNTEASMPSKNKSLRYIQMDTGIIKGMGTGGDPHIGQQLAKANLAVVKELFNDKSLVFLIVGLGGGTGTGAAPLLVEEASKEGAMTLSFATLPFEFEGKLRMERATQGMAALQKVSDAVISMPNQRLLAMINERSNLNNAFKISDEMLTQGIQATWRIVCEETAISIDFADLCELVKRGNGACAFACAHGKGRNKVKSVIKAIRNHPLLESGSVIARANSALISIIGGPDISLKEINEIVAGILPAAGRNALIKTGVGCEPALRDKLFITILVSEQQTMPEIHPEPGIETQIKADNTVSNFPGSSKQTAKRTALFDATPSVSSRQPKLAQGNLFEAPGRFKEIDPTIIDGNNLDIPTYLRRRLLIHKVHNNNY